MKISEQEADLYCSRCHDDTLHRVLYVNHKIKGVKCTVCNTGTAIEINLRTELYKEVYKRMTSKPNRLNKEYHDDLFKFIMGLPKRVLSKPYRLLGDVEETRDAMKKLNNFQKSR